MKVIGTAHGDLLLPAFLPDATRGVIKAVDSHDAQESGVTGLVVNAFHLSSRPGVGAVAQAGGIHKFMGWDLPIMSDSGGFQVMSLLAESPTSGTVSRHGFSYSRSGKGKREKLTPKNCIEKQLKIGADVFFCLDHCTYPDADTATQRESVDNTALWARQCKKEYLRRMEQGTACGERPPLFAVVQGGDSRELRRECAERLLEIGFDGYGFGGWPIGEGGRLTEMVAYVADLVPDELPLHGLGIGKPENLVAAQKAGYDTFDCVMPTRDARHRRIFVFNEDWREAVPDEGGRFYKCLYLQDDGHRQDNAPLEATCDCMCCRRYSRAYLHHLFRVRDALALRLATIHNLRFYSRLVERLGALDD